MGRECKVRPTVDTRPFALTIQPTECNICHGPMAPVKGMIAWGFTVLCPNPRCPGDYVGKDYPRLCANCKQPRDKKGNCTLDRCPSDF